MTACWMYGVGFEIRPTCDCCQREVERVRRSMWHGDDRICAECFDAWYDPDDGSYDPCNPVELGNHVRKKHGFPPIEDAP